VALVLNTAVVCLAVWLTLRAGHLPPGGYAVIWGLLLLPPVSAVVALLWVSKK
jgi:hypothetical protein